MSPLKEECREWSEDYLAEQFAIGPSGFKSPEAWGIVRSEALARGLVTDAMAEALESAESVGPPGDEPDNDETKSGDPFKWLLPLTIGGGLASVGAWLLASGHGVIAVFFVAGAVGAIRGTLHERAKEREQGDIKELLDDS